MSLTRRRVLVGAGGFVSAATLPALCLAEEKGDARLAVVSMRGGLDGLAAVPPLDDAHYSQARGALALDSGARIKLDDHFGLHVALRPLRDFYDRQELIVLPATGLADHYRSHRQARSALFAGSCSGGAQPTSRVSASWLGQSTAAGVFDGGPSCRVLDIAADLGSAAPLFQNLAVEREARESARFESACVRAGGDLGSPHGSRLALLELSGFDTHAEQGAQSGRLARTLETLADGLVALANACGPAWKHVAVLVVTEFGRSVTPNAMGGTDHGTASVAFLLGGAVAGGRVLGGWPRLAPQQLHRNADLAPTTDVRSIIKAVLADHLRLPGAVLASAYPRGVGAAAIPGLFRI